MQHVLIFATALVIPSIIIRTAIHGFMQRPKEATVVTVQGAHFHHLHLGVLLVFAASLLFLFTGVNDTSLIFIALGLGLILDEFIASIIVPNQEPTSTQLYLGSLKGTIVLLISLVVIVLAFSLALKLNL